MPGGKRFLLSARFFDIREQARSLSYVASFVESGVQGFDLTGAGRRAGCGDAGQRQDVLPLSDSTFSTQAPVHSQRRGLEETRVTRAAVVIQENRILFAGPENEIEMPSSAVVHDLEGLTILPGFFNTHVHEAALSGHTGPPGAVPTGGVGVGGRHDPSRRDLAARGAPALQAERGSAEVPPFARLLMSGPCIEVPGGRAETYNRLIIYSAEDARRKIEDLLDDGADVVKLYFEDGSIFGNLGM